MMDNTFYVYMDSLGQKFNQWRIASMRNVTTSLACFGVILVLAVVLAGCPPCQDGKTRVTAMFTADASAGGKLDVGVDLIQSLTVTLTEISLDRAGNGGGAEGEGEGEGEGEQDPSKVVVFSGAVDVNLLDLLGVSEVLASVEVPSGAYSKIRLSIENPRLVLVAAPEVELTNIQLTANGRLFVNEDFVLPEGQNSLILLDFGGIKLVQLGNGNYVLTPQLAADVEVTSADVSASGTITSIDTAQDQFVLAIADGELEVTYTDAAIYLPGDTETPTGAEDDLVAGAEVHIEGTLFVDGSVAASAIHVLNGA